MILNDYNLMMKIMRMMEKIKVNNNKMTIKVMKIRKMITMTKNMMTTMMNSP